MYRLWRDLGYAAGAVVSGLAADALGIRPAIWIVGALTFASGIIVAAPDEQRTAPRRLRSGPGAMSTWARANCPARHRAAAVRLANYPREYKVRRVNRMGVIKL